MSANGVKKFIAAIDLVYPAPQYDGDKTRQAAWVALYVNTLGKTDDDVLTETAATILRTRNPKKDGRFFPTPQECLEACQEVAEEMARRRTPLLEKPKELSYKTNMARMLIQAPLGQQAKREGWDTTLFHFVVDNQRLPQGGEIEACKAKSRAFKATYEELVGKPDSHPNAGPLARWAENMMRKVRERMGEKAA
jgi:hypothetical protein